MGTVPVGDTGGGWCPAWGRAAAVLRERGLGCLLFPAMRHPGSNEAGRLISQCQFMLISWRSQETDSSATWRVCMCVCVRTWVHACTYVYLYMCTTTHTCVHVRAHPWAAMGREMRFLTRDSRSSSTLPHEQGLRHRGSHRDFQKGSENPPDLAAPRDFLPPPPGGNTVAPGDTAARPGARAMGGKGMGRQHGRCRQGASRGWSCSISRRRGLFNPR